MSRSSRLLAAAFTLTLCACAGAKVDPKALTAAVDAAPLEALRDMDCDALGQARLGLGDLVAGATVKPTAVDYTDASQIANARSLSPAQTAASVGLTTVKSTIPGAGFVPLISGSAFRSAARAEAIGAANVQLGRLEGAMLAKGCDFAAAADAEGDLDGDETIGPASDGLPDNADGVAPAETTTGTGTGTGTTTGTTDL